MSQPDTWVLAARSVAEATAIASQADGDVAEVYQDYVAPHTRWWQQNDPLYPYVDIWNRGQGYLSSMHTEAAWEREWTGLGVTIGICDDSVERDHPDLAPNYDATDSYDFGQLDDDPSPVGPNDGHGVSVAGLAAARGGNGIGITGAAPYARIAGLRLPFDTGAASGWDDAIRYHSTGSNRTIQIKNHSYGMEEPFISNPSEVKALNESIKAGTIHVWAAGNNRAGDEQNADANKQAILSVPGQIVVAAGETEFAYYSSYGSNITVTAPSSNKYFGIVTTDRTGVAGYSSTDYTNGFGGTSGAAPLVSGVLALVKQAQPKLDGRFAKHLLAISSDKIHPKDQSRASDGGWKTNAAGIDFNENYGFGLINADRLTNNALIYSGVTPLKKTDTGKVNVSATIPDKDLVGITRSFDVAASAPLEEVIVTLKLTHPKVGDLEVYLTSPSGYRTRLLVKHAFETASMDQTEWSVLSNAFWGENPQGTWKLTVIDNFRNNVGTLHSFRMQTRNGSLVAKPLANNGSVFIAQADVPISLSPGQTFQPTFTFKNTGTIKWTQTGGYYLRSVEPAAGSVWGVSGQTLPSTIKPGQTVVFSPSLKAPEIPGKYSFSWQMANGNGPFGAASPSALITVR